MEAESSDSGGNSNRTRSRSGSIKGAQESNTKTDEGYKATVIVEGEEANGKQQENLETSATGRVKLAIFWMYIRSMSLGLFLGGVLFLFLTQIAWLGSNIWLADWSNDASKFVNATNISPNQTSLEPVKSVGLRLGVYASIGTCQGKLSLKPFPIVLNCLFH
ncbi:unnamed protein product [Hydatigera taeniaeformis]|uniref:SLC3A2_N domain-containing protein n=1 Tax=Hydatigena taeniaeformis TaxID=6205 RepID=A0A0R3WXQ9_HYDTA|nr:unnamed protein product [Hydatigera taeniaeformis]